jgi:hypothetical protein
MENFSEFCLRKEKLHFFCQICIFFSFYRGKIIIFCPVRGNLAIFCLARGKSNIFCPESGKICYFLSTTSEKFFSFSRMGGAMAPMPPPSKTVPE